MVTPPPLTPPPTKVIIVGRNEIHLRENLVGPFLVHKLLRPPPSNCPRLTASGWSAAFSRI